MGLLVVGLLIPEATIFIVHAEEKMHCDCSGDPVVSKNNRSVQNYDTTILYIYSTCCVSWS